MSRNTTARALAARARRAGAPSAADIERTTAADWRRFEQYSAALTYVDAATTPEARAIAASYIG